MKYGDSHHGHVVTGNLDIIGSVELRNLLSKGLNHRDQVKPCKNKAYKEIKKALIDYISKMEKKLKKPKPFFDHWKNVVLEKVWTHLEKRNSYNVNSVLTKNCVKKELEELQMKYVFAPTDKAANHSAGKHDRGPLFFTLFSFRLIRSRLTGSI